MLSIVDTLTTCWCVDGVWPTDVLAGFLVGTDDNDNGAGLRGIKNILK